MYDLGCPCSYTVDGTMALSLGKKTLIYPVNMFIPSRANSVLHATTSHVLAKSIILLLNKAGDLVTLRFFFK